MSEPETPAAPVEQLDPIGELANALAWDDLSAGFLERRFRTPEVQATLAAYAASRIAAHSVPDEGRVLFVLTVPATINGEGFHQVAEQLNTAVETVAPGRASPVAVVDGYRLETLADDALAQLGLRRTDGEAECAAALREASAQLDTALERHAATREGQHV